MPGDRPIWTILLRFGIGHNGIRTEELAEFGIVVTGIHVDEAGGILLLAGEGVSGGQRPAGAQLAIGEVGLAGDGLAVAGGGEHGAAQAVRMQVSQHAIFAQGDALPIEEIILADAHGACGTGRGDSGLGGKGSWREERGAVTSDKGTVSWIIIVLACCGYIM